MSVDICETLHQNFIDFSYEANSERAFPSVFDGLKPGQRACLWEMFTKGYVHKKPHVKSAKIAGGVVATWHPHGDVAVYETFARMSQPWINQLPEVEWHGANGNQIIPGGVASARYTEARLSKAAEDGMFYGIKKNNVPMILNFSEDEEWPMYLPSIFPRLLVNGSQGIGVSISQYWIPHNLTEVGNLILRYLETDELDYSTLVPDFPSGGIIVNSKEIHKIYDTGVGKVVLRAKTEIKNNSILITELPYQIYAEPLIDEIKDGITKEKIVGIKNIYNKSDKKRLLIEIETDGNPSAVLNQLFKETNLQKNYTTHQYALVGKTPKMLNLQEYIDLYLQHNFDCIKREYEFEIDKTKARLEIIEGLLKALEDIDNIIKIIKESKSTADARDNLKLKYEFTDNQTKAIVDMKLGKLARLEGVALQNEQTELNENLKKYLKIVEDKIARTVVFAERLTEFIDKYGTDRHTEVTNINLDGKEIEKESVVPQDVVVALTNKNFVNRTDKSSVKVQKRKGKGIKTAEHIIATKSTNTKDNLLLFTDTGMMHKILVDKIPESGTYLEDLVKIHSVEKIVAMTTEDESKEYICFITKGGYIKKTKITEFTKTKKNTASRVIKLEDDDYIIGAFFADDEDDVLITSSEENTIRFNLTDFTATGKTSRGCLSMKFKSENAYIINACLIGKKDEWLTIAYSNGTGKRVPTKKFKCQKRNGVGIGTKGIVSIKVAAAGDTILVKGEHNTICIPNEDISTEKQVILIKDTIKEIEVL